MGRIAGREAIKAAIKKYGGSGVDFFSLKDDNDEAKIRFLHTDDSDFDLVLVHKVEVEGKERWVECLAEETEGNCPLCANDQPSLKLFIFLYDYSDDKIKVWERGQTMIDTLLGYVDKCGHLNNRDYEIVRHGKKNSNKTSYQLFNQDKGPMREGGKPDGKEIEIPAKPELFGRFVLQWTADEIKEFLAGNEPQPQQKERKGKKNGPGF